MTTCPSVAASSVGDELVPARLAHLLRLALAVVDGCAVCWTRHGLAARREGSTGVEVASAMRMCLHEARAELALHYVLAVHAQAPQRVQQGEALRRAGFLPTQIVALEALVANARHGSADTDPADSDAGTDSAPARSVLAMPSTCLAVSPSAPEQSSRDRRNARFPQ